MIEGSRAGRFLTADPLFCALPLPGRRDPWDRGDTVAVYRIEDIGDDDIGLLIVYSGDEEIHQNRKIVGRTTRLPIPQLRAALDYGELRLADSWSKPTPRGEGQRELRKEPRK